MRIRRATADDVEFLVDVTVEATRDQGRLPAGFDEAGFRTSYGEWNRLQVTEPDAGSTTYVILDADERVGRLRVVRSAETIELAGIQLLPRVQGDGIGTAVVERLEAEALASGRRLELGVGKDNPRARALYERLGFVATGEDGDEIRMRWVERRG